MAVTLFEKDVAEFEALCRVYELGTNKRRKWNKTRPATRLSYAKLVLSDLRFKDKLFYKSLQQTHKPDYDNDTIQGIQSVFASQYPKRDYEAEIYIDGINSTKRGEYQTQLRKLSVKVSKVHQARDESHPLIRLADTLAGLVRSAIEGEQEARELVLQAKKLGTLREV